MSKNQAANRANQKCDRVIREIRGSDSNKTISSEPGLRGELPAASAEEPLIKKGS